MITVKCSYENGDTVTTSIFGTFKEVERYFVGNEFNLGVVEDNIQRCTGIELISEGL